MEGPATAVDLKVVRAEDDDVDDRDGEIFEEESTGSRRLPEVKVKFILLQSCFCELLCDGAGWRRLACNGLYSLSLGDSEFSKPMRNRIGTGKGLRKWGFNTDLRHADPREDAPSHFHRATKRRWNR